MAKPVYNALIIGVNCFCSNLNFFKKGDYPSYYYLSYSFFPVRLLRNVVGEVLCRPKDCKRTLCGEILCK